MSIRLTVTSVLAPAATPGPAQMNGTFDVRSQSVCLPQSPFLAVVITVVAPEHDDRVVGVRTGFQCVEHAAHHRIGVTHAGEVTVDRVIDGTQFDQFFVMLAFPVLLLLANLRWQVFQIVVFVRRQLDFRRVIQIEVLLRTVVRKVRGVDAARQEERLVVCRFSCSTAQLIRIVSAISSSFSLGIAPHSRKSPPVIFCPLVVNTCREWIGKGSFLAP